VLLRNYELDTVGQADRDALEQARADISMYENLIAFTKNLINSQAMVTTDDQGIATLIQNPPPPPPPPPAAAGSAPAPPEVVSGAALVRRYEDALLETEARADELVLKLADCFAKDRASGVVCGLSSNEAPYPWSALNNGKCRGHDTLSTREGDYCGYCKPVAIQTNTLFFTHLALSRASCARMTRRSFFLHFLSYTTNSAGESNARSFARLASLLARLVMRNFRLRSGFSCWRFVTTDWPPAASIPALTLLLNASLKAAPCLPFHVHCGSASNVATHLGSKNARLRI